MMDWIGLDWIGINDPAGQRPVCQPAPFFEMLLALLAPPAVPMDHEAVSEGGVARYLCSEAVKRVSGDLKPGNGQSRLGSC